MACSCTKNKEARAQKRREQAEARKAIREQQLAKRKEKANAPVQT